MRAYSERRIIIEYVRILRLFTSPPEFFQPEPFGDDLLALLQSGVNRPALWHGHEWYLGNVEADLSTERDLVGISARFGWSEDVSSPDVPPRYNVATHRWADEFGQLRHGAVALFTLDPDPQLAAVTSLAGDVAVPGFCHALGNLLNREELEARQHGGDRALRDWVVSPVVQKGSFDTWVESMDRVTSISASFHIPNPRTLDDLQPAVDFLTREGASKGYLKAENPDGLQDPTGDPLVNSAVAMQENDYGTITAKGEAPDGREDQFKSADHPARDVVTPDAQDGLSLRGLIVRLKDALEDRRRRGV
jgi:hypothetical protein